MLPTALHYWIYFLHLVFAYASPPCSESQGLQVLTIATDTTDSYKRFSQSAQYYGYDVKVVDHNEETHGPQTIAAFHDITNTLKDQTELIVMIIDSENTIFADGPEEIVKKFKKYDAKIVFTAKGSCWSDEPNEKKKKKNGAGIHLRAQGFIGYAPDIYEMISKEKVNAEKNHQLFCDKIFPDKKQRHKHSIKLDTDGKIFHAINDKFGGEESDVELKFKGNQSYIKNTKTGYKPIVIHSKIDSKHHLNSLGNYMADQWTPLGGCRTCLDNNINLSDDKPEDMPTVFLAVFLPDPIPFLTDLFDKLGALNYPKNKMSLFLHASDIFHKTYVDDFIEKHGSKYSGVELYGPEDKMDTWEARNRALTGCLMQSYQYIFYIDGEVQLENPDTLLELIRRNRSVIAPLLIRPDTSWSSFWGTMDSDGYYEDSEDYYDIMEDIQTGTWNVPFIRNAILIQAHHIPALLDAFIFEDLDGDMAFCQRLREMGIFMYVDNLEYYGHLVSPDEFDMSHKHNDLYQLFENRYTWEKKYLHEEYDKYMDEDMKHEEPCTDVFWQPLVSATFCEHLIGEMEHYGQWSGGGHNDKRIQGGYENVPTDDIHTNQIDWEKHWLDILDKYVRPTVEKVYAGYTPDCQAHMNFVVRYNANKQDRLKPHYDTSTWTVNLALNRPLIDYQGGGVRFLRYNCSIINMKQGWYLTHPGRVTHQHEGLPTTGGTRYIMVSFVDP